MPAEAVTSAVEQNAVNGAVLHDTRSRSPTEVVRAGAPISKHEAMAAVANARARMLAEDPEAREAAEEATEERASESVTQEVQPEAPAEGAEAVSTEEPAPEATRAPPATSSEGALQARLDEMERRHQAELATMQDGFQRQLDLVTQVAIGRAQPQGGPDQPPEDPDINPGVFIKRLEARVAQSEARAAIQEHEGRVTMVNDHVTKLFGESKTFGTRKVLSADLAERVVTEMFADPKVTVSNWKGEAARRVADIETRLAPDLPAGRVAADVKAAAVKRVIAAKATAVPTGAGSATPGAGMPEPKPPKPGTDAFRDFALRKMDEFDRARAR